MTQLFKILLHAGAVCGFVFAASVVRAEPSDSRPPNIVFIFADDWGWGDLSCHGHPWIKTPNIDRLAREGTDFERFTVASGVCSPSRTAVMTGRFPAQFNIDGHFGEVSGNARRNMPDWLSPSVPLLPRILSSAGYATAHYGKWHLGNDMIPDSPPPSAYGYDDYGAFNCSGEQMPVHEDSARAVAFIEKCAAKGQPFFINLWMHEPHTPFHSVPKYEWRFRDMPDRAERIYASVLSHADDRIGEVLDALDRLGLADNTLVVFSSDNGPARSHGPEELELMYDSATGVGWGLGAAKGSTAGRKGWKGSLFEGGINVPFIARWPGKIPAGRTDSESLISAVDLLPTFCKIANAPLPADFAPDGISQVETLMGNSSPGRAKPLFWKIGADRKPNPEAPNHWASYAVVHGTWKLLANEDSTQVELYDLKADPMEKNNRAASSPEAVQELLSLLEKWKTSLPSHPTGDVFSKLREKQSS